MKPLYEISHTSDHANGIDLIVGFSICYEIVSRYEFVQRDGRGRPLRSKIPVTSRHRYPGGTSFDVAVASKMFGLKPHLMASVSEDTKELERQFIIGEIENMGLSFHPLTVKSHTSVGNIIIEGEFDPIILSSKFKYIRSATTAVEQETKALQPAMVVATGLMPEETEMAEAMFTAAGTAPRVLNPRMELIEANAYFTRLLKLSPLVFINHEELGKAIDCTLPEDGVRREHIDRLHELGADAVIVTCNESGAVMSIRSQDYWHTQDARRFGTPIDKTGAGDSFLSGCIAAIFNGKNPDEMLRWGATCAGLKVLREGGSNVPSLEDFKNAL
ncbi:MAG: carbohydrate kinase family protein [Candidatus Kerfeldbacteria bacterium]|nr:carbohydrate kinase family protein [Candidatus Kerfeldbacteria bacterium]